MAQLYSLTETDGMSIKVDLTHVGSYIFTQQWDAGTTIGVVSLYLNPWHINLYGDTRVALRLLRGVTEISCVILDCTAWGLGNQWIDFDFGGVVLNTKAAYSFQLVSYGALNAYWNCKTGNPKTVGYTLGYDSRYMSVPVQQSDGWDGCMVVNGGAPGPQKPTSPYPANGSGPGINFATRTVSWVDGGGAATYTIRMDPGDTPYNVVSLSQTGTSYTIPEADISRYKDNIISWRVDAEAGGETVTGDVWTFDPRPAKATTPSPTNGASNTALNLTTLSWVKDAYTDTSEVNCSWSGSVSPFSTSSNSIALANYTPLYMDRLGYSNTYTWSVDTTNEWGTTDGDDWTFDTISYAGASCSWKNYDGKTLGPFDGGLEGVDYYWLGTNCISTVKRVVAFAADRVWITEV